MAGRSIPDMKTNTKRRFECLVVTAGEDGTAVNAVKPDCKGICILVNGFATLVNSCLMRSVAAAGQCGRQVQQQDAAGGVGSQTLLCTAHSRRPAVHSSF
ncbi:hypothetical protein TcG_07276 [Trypanosoma cruzi]|nr:hypothetical protein TcG_07276 [Trypanosoma cruzi]